jgi:hypothetical protein
VLFVQVFTQFFKPSGVNWSLFYEVNQFCMHHPRLFSFHLLTHIIIEIING